MLTIETSPGLIEAAYSIDGANLTYLLDSTVKNWAGMNYTCDLWVENQYVDRFKLDPNTVDLKATFTLNRVLEDFLSPQPFAVLAGATALGTSFKEFFCVFGEETDGTPGATGATFFVTLGPTSQTAHVWNSTTQYADPVSYETYYLPQFSPPTPGRFLTNAPSSQNVSVAYSDSLPLYYLTAKPTSAFATSLNVRTVSATGAVTAFVVAGVPVGATYDMEAVGAGPNDINTAASLGLVTQGGTTYGGTVVTCATVSYEVDLVGFLGLTSETRTFVVDCCEGRFTPVRLTWLNPLGGYDSYTFKLKGEKRTDVARLEYDAFLSRYGRGTSGGYGYRVGDRGRSVYDVQARTKVSAVSDWLTQEEYDWLGELFLTQSVFVVDYNAGNPRLLPVVCTSDGFDHRNKEGFGNRLLSRKVELSYAYDTVVQRG